MRVSRKHLLVVIAEMTMIVTAFSALTFFILTLLVNKEPFDLGLLFSGERIVSFFIFLGYMMIFLFLSLITALFTLIHRHPIGFLYSLQYLLFGPILGICFMLIPRIATYKGDGFILSIVEISLTIISMISAFAMLFFFFMDGHEVLVNKIAKARLKKEERRFNKEKADFVDPVGDCSLIEPKEVKVRKLERDDEDNLNEENKEYNAKVYHVSQHSTTNKWQVKLAKGERALKLFDTQAEALVFAKTMAKKQGGSVRLHSRKGKMRSA